MIFALIIIALIILDQISKIIVVRNMGLYQDIEIIHDFFYITSHRNKGAAWGMLQGQMTFFYIITIIMVGVLVYYLLTTKYNEKKLFYIALILMFSGAIGNFIDRIFRKEVVDFLNFYIFGYDFPVFNIADSFLTIGIILFIIDTLIEIKNEKRTKLNG